MLSAVFKSVGNAPTLRWRRGIMRCCRRFVFLLCAVATVTASATAADLRIATTTSVENSGLLAHLTPHFEQLCDCRLHIIPVGSGKALAMGRRGDVDVLLTHSPADERAFVADGYGVDYHPIAHNYFVLLAPAPPATPSGDAPALLATLAQQQQPRSFVSRGDFSGTHKKELALWEEVKTAHNIAPDFDGDWYVSAGIGMGQAIVMADELRAHTLSDAGTYLFFADKTDLTVVSEQSESLKNVYSIMRINTQKFSHSDAAASALAQQFVRWITGEDAQQLIGEYRLHGQVLFYPAADNTQR